MWGGAGEGGGLDHGDAFTRRLPMFTSLRWLDHVLAELNDHRALSKMLRAPMLSRRMFVLTGTTISAGTRQKDCLHDGFRLVLFLNS